MHQLQPDNSHVDGRVFEQVRDAIFQNFRFRQELTRNIDWVAQAFLITLTGFPAASAPAGLSDSRLPVGLQIIGPRLGEPTILAVAKLLQQVRPVGWPPAAI